MRERESEWVSECVCVCVQVDIASGVVVVEQCDLSGESDAVVRIHNAGTQAVLRGNLIHDSTGAGVVVAASAAPTLVDNDIRAHQLDGLSLISLSLSFALSFSLFLSLSVSLSLSNTQTNRSGDQHGWLSDCSRQPHRRLQDDWGTRLSLYPSPSLSLCITRM